MNRYGPPPAAIDALRDASPPDLQMHPHDAADRLCEVYATALGVPTSELLTGRAPGEIIWAMGRILAPRTVAIPLPAYPDYLRAFPGRSFGPAAGCGHSIDQLDAALAAARVVLISNPHNPTGSALAPHDLTALAQRHPRSVLVVDESYVEFLRDPAGASMVGRNRTLLTGLVGVQETRGLSGLDVSVVTAALSSDAWAADVRHRLLADSRWLAGVLDWLPGVTPQVNDQVHFQYALSPQAPVLAALLADHGVGVRILGRAHGIVPGALRVVAPRRDERNRVAAAFAIAAESLAEDGAPSAPVAMGTTAGARR